MVHDARDTDFRSFRCSRISELDTALAEAVSELVTRVLPQQEETGPSWDMIRFEIWTDTGRIIVFPAATPFEERIDVAAVQVVCTEARDTIDSATHSDISDEAYGVIESKVTARLVAAVHRIAKAKLRFEYGVFYYGDAVADTT